MGTAPIGLMNDWHWMDGRNANTLAWLEPDCLKCGYLINNSTHYFKCDTEECPAKCLNAAQKKWLGANIKLFDVKGDYFGKED